MKVDRLHPAELGERELQTALVIDVMRATSTAVVLLSRDIDRVEVVAVPESLARLAGREDRRKYLVFSELDAAREYGLECVENSPAVASKVPLEGRHPVLVTTNGTRAIEAAMACSDSVYVATFLNLTALVRQIRGAESVTVLPAGNFAKRERRTEDERCADALEELLAGRTPDYESLLADCWNDALLRRRMERNPGLEDDVRIALSVDELAVVPRVRRDEHGCLTLVAEAPLT